jgi:hypothetical protein
MKLFLFLLLFILAFLTESIAQNQSNKNQYLSLSLGQGYDDGIISLTRLPTIGFGYEKELNRFLSLNIRMFSFYRKQPDGHFISDFAGRLPIMDVIAENAWGPFITQADKDKIKNVGVKDFDPSWTVKMLSLPVILGANIYPLNYMNHKLGINLGLGLSYSSYNYSKDFYPVKQITLNDGSVYRDLYLSMGTEFKNLDFIESIVLLYEYRSKNIKFGFRFGSYGRYFGGGGMSIWEAAVNISLKI